MGRFQPRDLREGTSLDELRRELNEIQRLVAADLTSALGTRRVTELQLGDYAASYGDVVRFAPPVGGARLILPAPNPARLGDDSARVTAALEASTGGLTVEVVDGTINGATTLTYAAGVGSAEFVLTPTGWFTWSPSLLFSGALTGEVTKAATSTVTTVTRSTDFQSSPWTGNHQFNGEIRGGTLTSTSASGAVNITLDAGSTRLLFTSSSTITLGTISGAADGRLLFLEKTGTGALVITHDAASANAVACPNDENLTIKGRGGILLVGRLGTNANWKVHDHQIDPANLLPETANRGAEFSIRVSFSAAAAGTADDVTVYNAAAPFGFRIIDCRALISTAIGGSTVTLRDTSGGGGSALSSALSSAATGTARNNDTVTRTVATGGSVFLRRSDRGVAGEIVIIAIRT